ncbi:MAG: hypothetical protein U5L07_05270 [Desulfobacterales bacterium]|nr:hypothetical protein [Desulfobacterales bacterium]
MNIRFLAAARMTGAKIFKSGLMVDALVVDALALIHLSGGGCAIAYPPYIGYG